MQEIQKILWKNLPYDRRQRMDIHIDSMLRELKCLRKTKNIYLLKAIKLGWNEDVLNTICVLSVFNYYIIWPLTTSGKRFSNTKFNSIDSISHGSMSLDGESAEKIAEACTEFNHIISSLSINLNTLHSNSAKDIVYYIARGSEDESN